MPEFSPTLANQIEFLFRILLSAACGMSIGWEREKRLKSAGLRTHMLVSMAAALMMLISKYGFLDVVHFSSVHVDVSRMAGGVVQAIGFLGAGVIFVKRDTIVGVTTAAGLWATVGIGLAAGAGMYVLTVLATILILVIQLLVHKVERKAFSTNTGAVQVNLTKHKLSLSEVKKKLDEYNVLIRNISLTRDEKENQILTATIVCARDATVSEVITRLTQSDFVDAIDIYTVE